MVPGDLVQPSLAAECVCGRHELALEGGILGRADDMVIVRGVNIFPSAVEDLIRRVGGIAEYQVTVTQDGALSELSVRVETEPDCRDAGKLVKQLQKLFLDTLNLRMPVTAVAPGILPRYEMKARRWIKS